MDGRSRRVWKWVFRVSMLSAIATPWIQVLPPFRR
jgi:hypothetical protein